MLYMWVVQGGEAWRWGAEFWVQRPPQLLSVRPQQHHVTFPSCFFICKWFNIPEWDWEPKEMIDVKVLFPKSTFISIVVRVFFSFGRWPVLLVCMWGFPGGSSGKESTCQYRRCRFDPWVGKIPWRKKWQPTPVFLLGLIPWPEKPGDLWPTVRGVEKRRLKQLSIHV